MPLTKVLKKHVHPRQRADVLFASLDTLKKSGESQKFEEIKLSLFFLDRNAVIDVGTVEKHGKT